MTGAGTETGAPGVGQRTEPGATGRPAAAAVARGVAVRLGWPLGVVVAVFGFALVPALLEPDFYLRGDSGAQFAPTWWHLGQLLREGRLPPVLDPGSFAGGNYGAEALFGIYNPVNWLIWLAVSGSDDLRVSVTLVKAAVMAALALGAYLLSREYGAARWAAGAVAVALPFGGFTLFWDGGSWAAGLVAFAWTPWVWWAFRRALHGRLNPFVAFAVGAMGVLQGNPYGTLAVALVGVALVVEGLLTRRWRGLGALLLVGGCVAALLPLVYLPLVETVALGPRTSGSFVEWEGKLRPSVLDVLLLGSPTYVPPVEAITGPMQVPATYFAWFLVPLLPWLRLGGSGGLVGRLRRRLPELAAIAVAGLVWLAMTVGPAKLWLFRWPLRLSEYAYLCLAVLLALLLSRGLARDRWLLRAGASMVLVLVVAAVAEGQAGDARRIVLGAVAVLALTAVTLLVHRVVPARAWLLGLVLVLGTGGVLATQVRVFGENASSRVWHFPTDVEALQLEFARYGEAPLLQLADLRPVQRQVRESGDDAVLRAQWSDYLAGTMFRVAGLDAVNSYTGMGLRDFTRRLCMTYEGLTRPCGYRQLWQPVAPGQPSLADLLKIETVVVQPRLAEGVEPGPGWTRDDGVGGAALVLRRDLPPPWPGSRLSTNDGVVVEDARTLGSRAERVEVASAPDGGTLVFAALGWPGYAATLDGEELAVDRNAVGLLTVGVPPGASGTVEVEFTPPGRRLGLVLGVGAILVAGLAGALDVRRRVRRLRARSGA